MRKLFTIICMASVLLACAEKPETLVDDYDPAAMEAAILKAKSTVGEFITVLGRNEADSFSVKAPITDPNGTEHFWISDVHYENDAFTGTIGNEPGIVKNVEEGQIWTVKKAEISDWMYMRSDKIYGGFTIDPLLASFPKDKADAIRSKLVRGSLIVQPELTN